MIPALNELLRNGDPRRRAAAGRRIAELYLQGAANLGPEHVELFDALLVNLIPDVELTERAVLAEKLSFLDNAPRKLVSKLAREDELLVAGPLLRRSPVLDEPTLLEIALSKGQGHLLAMSDRPTLSPALTDVIMNRGDRDTIIRAAGNSGALFSDGGYSKLIKRAGQDGSLTLAVGTRDDLSDERLKELLTGSTDTIRRRLLEAIKPDRHDAIAAAMSEISAALVRDGRRDFMPAHRTILGLQRANELNEGTLLGFAKAHKYEESVAGLAAMSGVDVETLDRVITADRYDPILIIGKVLGLGWPTVHALIRLRLGHNRVPSPSDIENARVNFGRLTPSTAERVVSFWQARQSA